MGSGVGPEPGSGVPEPPQQIFAPQLLDVVAFLFLDLLEFLTDLLGLGRLGGLGLGLLGFDAAWSAASALAAASSDASFSALASAFLAFALSLALSVSGSRSVARPEP